MPESIPDRLLSSENLLQSPVVANCRMNRERNFTGTNSYAHDLRFDIVTFLESRAQTRSLTEISRPVRWLDLCCGTGRALIQAATQFYELGLSDRVSIVGIDLVDMFDAHDSSTGVLSLQALPVEEINWSLGPFDLVTSVHGLHYIGDKLAVIAAATGALADDGLFLAHLDLANLRLGGTTGNRHVTPFLRRSGLQYNARSRLLQRSGRLSLAVPYAYQGADDAVGPNWTGQPAVCSHYKLIPDSSRQSS